ncbi:MAG: hypothetical protein F4Z04_05500 [Acidobacteria bacterium]|nr:hypothetical protein [Acidobacteriota bacterium]
MVPPAGRGQPRRARRPGRRLRPGVHQSRLVHGGRSARPRPDRGRLQHPLDRQAPRDGGRLARVAVRARAGPRLRAIRRGAGDLRGVRGRGSVEQRCSRRPVDELDTRLTSTRHWRLRVGDYRVIFRIDMTRVAVMMVMTVRHRSKAYG